MFLSPVVDSNNSKIWYVPSRKDQARPVKADEKIAWMVVIDGTPIIEVFLDQNNEAAWVRRSISAERKLQGAGMCPLGRLIQEGVPLNARTKTRFKNVTPEKELDTEIDRIVQGALREIQREWAKGFPQVTGQVIEGRPWTEFPQWEPVFSEKELQYMDFGGWVKLEEQKPASMPNVVSLRLAQAWFDLRQAFA